MVVAVVISCAKIDAVPIELDINGRTGRLVPLHYVLELAFMERKKRKFIVLMSISKYMYIK